jgi:hypothetical protein
MTEIWRPEPRTAEAQNVYTAAEEDRKQHPEQYRLDAAYIIKKALKPDQPSISTDTKWREGLGVYIDSAREEGHLNALGIKTMMATAVGRLRAGIAIRNFLEKHPHVYKRQIHRPVFIIGGWRTGTTLLQRLLASAPNLRGVYPSELSAPWRCAADEPIDRDRLAKGARKAHKFLHLLNPAMKTIHPSGEELPEECVLAMGTDFKNWGFTSTLRCPEYAAWLTNQDFRQSYERYADILRMLEDDSNRRWVLKAPAHTAELPALLSAFPDACIIHLHRDIVQTVASSASLFAVFRSTYSDQVYPEDVGRLQLDQTGLWLDRAMKCRENPPVAASPTYMDLAYKDLVADPVAAARLIYERFDIDWSAGVADRFNKYLRTHPRNKHGRHLYTPEQFGLDPGEIRERLSPYTAWAGLA